MSISELKEKISDIKELVDTGAERSKISEALSNLWGDADEATYEGGISNW